MSTTLLKEINGVPIALYNDGTNVYTAYSSGKITKTVISTKVETSFKVLTRKLYSMISDATYLYVGTGDGELLKITIADASVMSTLEFFDSVVISLGLNSTNLYVGLANGQIRLKDLS